MKNPIDAACENDAETRPANRIDARASGQEHAQEMLGRRAATMRADKLRPPLVVRPSFVSQETAYAILGITPRKFLDVVVPTCAGDVIRVGRSVLIPLEVAESALLRRSTFSDGHVVEDDGERPQDTSVDAVLASVGMRRRVHR